MSHSCDVISCHILASNVNMITENEKVCDKNLMTRMSILNNHSLTNHRCNNHACPTSVDDLQSHLYSQSPLTIATSSHYYRSTMCPCLFGAVQLHVMASYLKPSYCSALCEQGGWTR